MKRRVLASTIIPILIVLGFVFYFTADKSEPMITISNANKHRGICWVAGPNEVSEDMIEALVERNVEWISQTPFGWQRGHDNPQIGTNQDVKNSNYQAWWGERDEGLRMTTRMAKKHGIKTLLKPHIWLRDEGGKWRGEIKMKSEEDWKTWFSEYEEFILHYAKLAEEEQMEMLCIGTELHQTCVERADDWRALIAKIRTVYSGPLTYAANFSKEYTDVSFWDALDFIGVQAYFPLANEENPSLESLKKGWEEPMAALETFSNKQEKPVLFTEIGYKSTHDTAIEPWTWPQRIDAEKRKAIYSEKAQALCYQAFYEAVWDAPWLAGIYWWKWYPGYESSPTSSDVRYRDHFNVDFTPQKKQAERIMRDGFARD